MPEIQAPAVVLVEAATEVDYFLTNASEQHVTAEWIAQTYSQRNWVEVFYRNSLAGGSG